MSVDVCILSFHPEKSSRSVVSLKIIIKYSLLNRAEDDSFRHDTFYFQDSFTSTFGKETATRKRVLSMAQQYDAHETRRSASTAGVLTLL